MKFLKFNLLKSSFKNCLFPLGRRGIKGEDFKKKIILKTALTFYFLICISLFAKSQTLQAPDLQCVNAQSNGDILLTWSNPAPDPCGAFIGYVIYGDTVGTPGPYIIITTVTVQTQTTYTATGLTGIWNFYMVSSYACAGFTSLSSDTVDSDKPLPPVIDFVTVQSPTEVLIQFTPSTSPEAYSYIIYEVIGGSNIPIDTIYFGNATTYIDTTNTVSGSHTYLIAARDSCNNTGLISTLKHNSIFGWATTANCTTAAKLSWNKYNNWVGGVDHYDVFVSINNQPVTLLATTHDTTVNFIYSADSMCFSIVAYSANGLFTSTSNIFCLPPNPDSPVRDFYIRNVTVPSLHVVDVYYSMNKNSDVRTLKLGRGTDGINFSDIAIMSVPTNLTVINIYSDSSALTDQLSYYYRITAIDSCGAEYSSTIGNSIWLDGGAFSSQENHLKWESFNLTYGSVTAYTIFRKITTTFDSVLQVNPFVNEYQESVAELIKENGTLCYVIIATDTLHFPNGIIDTVRSRSNELCIDQIVKVLVPTAFAPNGINNIFKPVMRFADNKLYLFQVYNRWGGTVFSTNNIADGWDGYFQGRIVEQGVYAYLVQITDDKGNTTERKGTVMLLR